MARTKSKTEAPEAPKTTAPAANTVTTLPLFALCLSGLNVRRTERDADIAALAEDIAARGLKQNLVVTPAHFTTAETEDNFGDRFEVIAGGRRYQALQLLVEDGRLPHDHPVPVMVEARDEARETSLSENLHRVAMNPADEFEAFAAIAATWMKDHGVHVDCAEPSDGAIAYVAKRFGVTTRHVAGRLRLAALAPEILEALREGKITVEAAKAFASTAETARQSEIFKNRSKQGQHWLNDARGIRSELARNTVSASAELATFVTLDAYLAAGGRTETDMFMGTEGELRLVDVPLLKDLAEQRAAQLVPDLAKADGFASGLFAWGWSQIESPEGFARSFEYHLENLAAEARAESIGVYVIGPDGELKFETRLKPTAPAAPEAPRRNWAAERAAEERVERIEIKSAHLEVAALLEVGAPDPADLVWPIHYCDLLEEGDDEDVMLVVVQVKVKRSDVIARTDEATRIVDAELAAEQAATDAQRQAEADEEAEEDAQLGEDEPEDEVAD